MDATLAIAVWGAVTGTVAAAGGLVGLMRDKPNLAASQHIEVSRATEGRSIRMVLHVVNNGRRPITVFEAGFAMRRRTTRKRLRRVAEPVSMNGEAHGPEFPKRLDAGEPLTVTLDFESPNRVYIPDATPRGFAADTKRRVTWAEPEIDDGTLQGLLSEAEGAVRGPGVPPRA